jgi:hypothetical protein
MAFSRDAEPHNLKQIAAEPRSVQIVGAGEACEACEACEGAVPDTPRRLDCAGEPDSHRGSRRLSGLHHTIESPTQLM